MFKDYNPNPAGRKVGDCAVRAIAKALDTDWEYAYVLLTSNGFTMGDMLICMLSQSSLCE